VKNKMRLGHFARGVALNRKGDLTVIYETAKFF
jgi:hypothetical protein